MYLSPQPFYLSTLMWYSAHSLTIYKNKYVKIGGLKDTPYPECLSYDHLPAAAYTVALSTSQSHCTTKHRTCFVCCRCVFAYKFCLNGALCRVVSQTTGGRFQEVNFIVFSFIITKHCMVWIYQHILNL